MKSANVSDLYCNPMDDILNPSIGPSDTQLQYHLNYIYQNGTIESPILVQKLASGGYIIVDGHHRYLAAIKMGLESVPIEIVNYQH